MFKNVGESTLDEITLEKGFYVLHFQNESKDVEVFESISLAIFSAFLMSISPSAPVASSAMRIS